MTYKEFLERKIDIAPLSGIEIDPAEVSPALKDHQRVGRRGIFARFGLGKTIMQLEWCRLLQKHEGGQTLVVMPLNVLPEFKSDAVNLLGMERAALLPHDGRSGGQHSPHRPDQLRARQRRRH